MLQEIADEGLSPLVDIADQVNADGFSPRNGRIDMARIRARLRPASWRRTGPSPRAGASSRRSTPTSWADRCSGPVTELQTKVADAHSTVGAGAKAAQLIPDMFGGSGRRTYILAFQNNAEIRSTGGLPGAFAILRAKGGKLSLGAQGAGSTRILRDLPITATADEKRLYSILLTGYWGDTTLTPDFPRSAEIMRAMIRQDRGLKTDGVISLDPIALSYILEATGPVKLGDGTSLTSKNAVRRLLNDVYSTFPRMRPRTPTSPTRRGAPFEPSCRAPVAARHCSRPWPRPSARTAS